MALNEAKLDGQDRSLLTVRAKGELRYLDHSEPLVQQAHVHADKCRGQELLRMLKLVVHMQAAQIPQVCIEDHDVGPQVPGRHLQVLKPLQGQNQCKL